MRHIEDILTNLDLYRGDLHKGNWSSVFDERLASTIDDRFNLYAVFRFEEKPLMLFFDNPRKEAEHDLHKWIWNLNESPVAIVVNDQTVDVLNAFDMDGESKLLRKLVEEQELNAHFNYLKVVSGETWSELRDRLQYSNRVDYKLLDNLEQVRTIIVQGLKDRGAAESAYRIANALIGRLLFIRYLIDRRVKIHFGNYPEQRLTNDDLIEILGSAQNTFALFEHLKKEFNGDLFPFIDIEKERVILDTGLLQNFVRLFNGDDIASGQRSLFPLYDFSVIPIEFVSNVYEHFIGTDEADKKQQVSSAGPKEKNQQRKQGAYYTPKFLVDYVLAKTVGVHLASDAITSTCRVLDPACGSGIFLVETLRRLILRYQALNPDYQQDTQKYKMALCQLAWDNIFGIDIDDNAVDVAIFSLYITLLDYQTPADIETFRFPELRGRNFFKADSFNEEHAFNEKLKVLPFDFIIGNPPWGKTEGKEVYVTYCKKREKKEKIVIGASNKEAAQSFMLRVSDFALTPRTRIALVVTSKVLYNLQALDFRKYFLKHFFLDEILELSPVRHQVFDKTSSGKSASKAIAPASVIFYRWAGGADTSENPVQHNTLKPNIFFRLFKRFIFEKYDRKTVSQGQFLEYDWLFKLLVYGNVLDFHFLKRLSRYPTIGEEIIRRKEDFLPPKQGIKREDKYKKEKINTSDLVGWDFLDTQKKELRQFFIHPEHKSWQLPEVSHLPSKDVFFPPMLLITEGITAGLRSNSAISYKPLVFTSSIKAVKAKNNDGIPLLRNLAGLLNSGLFAYYMLMKGSSAAIEREQAHDEETFGFPFVESANIYHLVEQIEKNKKEIFERSDLPRPERWSLKLQENHLTEALDAEVFKAFSLTEEEKSLLQYAHDVSISIFRKEEDSPAHEKVEPNHPLLIEYAQVFLEYFKSRFTNYLGAEIFQSDYCIAIRIYNTDEQVQQPVVFKKDQTFQSIAELFFAQSFERITDKLFVQKDVRGFERKAFYIIKPNERKCWHKAVAYLDAYEFGEAIERL